MSLVSDIMRSYRAPRQVVEKRLGFVGEAGALATLMAAAALIFVSQWPNLAREAHLDPSIPLEARLGGALFGLLFVMPLIAYIAAGLIWAIMRFVTGHANALAVRFALFWALLAVTPLWLFHGFMTAFIGGNLIVDAIGLAVLVAFLAILIGGLKAARGQVAEI